MKTFKYDTLVSEEDICDRQKEKKRLLEGSVRGRRLILYAKRRFGKTSLVKNCVAPAFKKEKKGLYLYADLYQVRSPEDISQRIQIGVSQMMRASFPLRSLAKTAASYFRGAKTSLTFDPLTGSPSFSIEPGASPAPSLSELFEGLERISRDRPLLIILDEFQSIADVDQAEGLLRSELLKCSRSAVILLGSRRHILKEIFSDPDRPFYNFGSDMELKPIPWNEYAPYIRERLGEVDISVDDETVRYWLELMHHIPNSINRLGAWITDHYSNCVLGRDILHESIMNMVNDAETRFSTLMEGLTKNEVSFLIALAKTGPAEHVLSETFAKKASLKIPTIQKVSHVLLKKGMIEKEKEGTFVSDPLLAAFLKYQR